MRKLVIILALVAVALVVAAGLFITWFFATQTDGVAGALAFLAPFAVLFMLPLLVAIILIFGALAAVQVRPDFAGPLLFAAAAMTTVSICLSAFFPNEPRLAYLAIPVALVPLIAGVLALLNHRKTRRVVTDLVNYPLQ
jgi:hypothetical protein